MCQVSNDTNDNPYPSVELICISSVEAREAVEEGCREDCLICVMIMRRLSVASVMTESNWI